MKKLLALLALFPFIADATSLSTAAAALNAGGWASFSMTGLSATFSTEVCHTGSSNNALGESGELRWDPTTKQMFWLGSDHNEQMFMAWYADSSNTWSVATGGAWFTTNANGDYNCGMNHGEDSAALDPVNGVYYVKKMLPSGAADPGVYKCNTSGGCAAGTWTTLTKRSNAYFEDVEAADWFPEMNSYVIPSGGGGNGTYQKVYRYNETPDTWSSISQGLEYFGGTLDTTTRGFSTYSPFHHRFLFTLYNGSRDLFELTSAGTITTLRDSPINTGIMCPCSPVDSAINWADPLTGDFIFLTSAGQEMWRYDIRTDSWSHLSETISSNIVHGDSSNKFFSVASGMISDYNVVMFVTCESDATCRGNLYKHTSNSPPSQPAGLHLQ